MGKVSETLILEPPDWRCHRTSGIESKFEPLSFLGRNRATMSDLEQEAQFR